jgi:hypothetical protein
VIHCRIVEGEQQRVMLIENALVLAAACSVDDIASLPPIPTMHAFGVDDDGSPIQVLFPSCSWSGSLHPSATGSLSHRH